MSVGHLLLGIFWKGVVALMYDYTVEPHACFVLCTFFECMALERPREMEFLGIQRVLCFEVRID